MSLKPRDSDTCPKRAKHTPSPDGYLAWHEWAEKKSKRHYQVACDGCGTLSIWKRKMRKHDAMVSEKGSRAT